MKRLVDFFELLVGNMGINLSRGYGRMAEHGLDRADVGAVDEQIGGKGMAQGVRVNVFDDSGFGGVVFNDPLH